DVYAGVSAAWHAFLDLAGLIPGLGELADGLNALSYLAEGDPTNAAISAASMIPLVGDLAKGARYADDVAGVIKGACSFSGDTKVLMADGTTQPIQDIKVGDQILATNPDTGEHGPRTVTTVLAHQDTLLNLLTTDGATITTTEDHPFYNTTTHQWQPANQLNPGHQLHTPDGLTVTVRGLDKHTARNATAYNLTIHDLHTYYVLAHTTPVLVHNQCGSMSSAIGEDSFLAKAAQQAGRNQRVQQEMDGLFKQLSEGNMNPGIGTKSLAGTDVSYARGRNGARLFFRSVNGGMQIVGKADKGNESAVIRRLIELYGR
ncbi:MAG TPA: polymorphic toxin-type HINT domain-containing protein, partial [Actinophytocola sp.]|uniref:polymorphic toxin-type HINT domain-containing protein n=1 Tax=Actinophytocola sp. TaxID=1872138 RepID=UPI002DB80E62